MPVITEPRTITIMTHSIKEADRIKSQIKRQFDEKYIRSGAVQVYANMEPREVKIIIHDVSTCGKVTVDFTELLFGPKISTTNNLIVGSVDNF